MTGLTNGQDYLFTVAAENAVGTGAPSDAALATPVAPGPPAEPQLVVAWFDRGWVHVTWSAPLSDGGAPITQYLIERSVDGGKTWTKLATTVEPSFGFQASSTSVLLRVSAINDLGSSAPALAAMVTALDGGGCWHPTPHPPGRVHVDPEDDDAPVTSLPPPPTGSAPASPGHGGEHGRGHHQ